ncbi:hypothetical protein [Dactylosporangium sp. NPDC005555]|uniref:hypothetical protein n=1 Tax=Dactylosporangium sp. NPDC005555 TaxID=3154889 RepID=UPI0033BDD010
MSNRTVPRPPGRRWRTWPQFIVFAAALILVMVVALLLPVAMLAITLLVVNA